MLGFSRVSRPVSALCLVCCAIVALAACGGRSDTEDFRFSDDLSNGGTPSSGGVQNTGAQSTGGKKPGNGGTATTVGGSSVGGMATGGVATGGVGQAGTSFAGAVSMGGSGMVVPITCGNDVCNALTETCCATLGGFGCIPEDRDCGGAVLNCGSSTDCGGNQVCCLHIVGEVGSSSSCKNSCAGMGPGRERQLCTSDDDCGGQRRCRDTVFGVSVCTRF